MKAIRYLIGSLVLTLLTLTTAHAQRTATAAATLVHGFVVEIALTDGGSGYTSAPSVTISGGGGSGAEAIAIVSGGAVIQVVVTHAGFGYSTSPAVVISPPPALQVLDIQLHAALVITGAVGKVYSIEYVTDLTEPTESDWRCLEYLQLPASPYLWADESAPATGKRFYRMVAMEAPSNMVFIPPGTFRMGSPEDEVDRSEGEGPQTDVIISRGFWMGKYEVTQKEYFDVMGNNPSYFTGDTTRPVESVNWHDAVAYTTALTERERAAGRIPAHCVYRLPTEAEWEYACRGWTSTRFSYGDDPEYTNLTDYAWYSDNSGETTHPVGQKLPNPWGLHDMHGNVYEWCQDWWSNRLPGGIVVDPQGPAAGSDRVVRGGGWLRWDSWRDPRFFRSAYRAYLYSGRRLDDIGFRAVLAPGQP